MEDKKRLISSGKRKDSPAGRSSSALDKPNNSQIVDDNVENDTIYPPQRRKDSKSQKPKGSCSRSRLKIGTAFCISCLGKFVTGAVFVFFVYQDAIKHQFSYSQKEVEVLASMMNIGLGLGFLPGMFIDRFGPRMTSLAGLIITTGSYLLLWSTTFTKPFFSANSWLMAIFFLFTGFGPGFTLFVALNTNIMNFHKRHTGKVVGTLNAFFAGSPSVFATLYYNLFADGDKKDAEKQDFRGFMLMIAIMFVVINILNLLFVYRIPVSNPPEDSAIVKAKEHDFIADTDEKSPLIENEGPKNVGEIMEHEVHVPLLKILFNVEFILFLIMFSFASTASLVFGVNVTAISKSVKLDSYNETLTIISPITNAVFSIAIGVFSDLVQHRIPRLKFIICGCASFALCYLLVVVLPTSIVALMFAAFFCGVGIALLYSLSPTLVEEMFNMKNFGRNYGVALFAQSAVSMPSQILFGAMYDAHVPSGSHDCEGSVCFVGGMSVFLGMSVAAILIGIIMLNMKRCKRTHRQI